MPTSTLPGPQSVSAPATDSDAPSAPVAAAARLEYIDTLRGLAALWVAAYHTIGLYTGQGQSPNRVTDLLVQVVGFGQLGVNLFLVISGFCLFYPLARRNLLGDMPPVRFWPFMARRARRILPPYYALLTILVLWWYGFPYLRPHLPTGFPLPTWIESGGDVATHYLLIHNLFPKYVGSISTPFWSIALEWQLYFTFPLLVALCNKKGIWRVAAGAALVSLALHLALWRWLPGPAAGDERWRLCVATRWSLPCRLFEFVAGMLAAFYVARPHRRQTRIALIVGLAAVVPAVILYHRWDQFDPLINQVWGVTFAALIVLLAGVTRRAPGLMRVAAPVTAIGLFSYSFYLCHIVLLSAARVFMQAQKMTMSTTCLVFLAVILPLMLAYAFGFFCLFERPFMRQAPKRGRDPRAPVQNGVAPSSPGAAAEVVMSNGMGH
jgi:peptidoglycan/LPS O-acetylase OafA/YrhL